MTIDINNMLNTILEGVSKIEYIKTADIPNIPLYMDQVTTFMDSQLKGTKRYDSDKILTKTMINNYAKNDLLPPPLKKKYSKEHLLVLIFIYYFKSFLTITDIQAILNPITDRFFDHSNSVTLEDIYNEVFSLEKGQIEFLKEDLVLKYQLASQTFENVEQDQEFLKTFSFICLLSFDVYVKKHIIEHLIDQLSKK